RLAVLYDEAAADRLRQRVRAEGYDTEVLAGDEGLLALARLAEADTFVAASSGSVGLEPTHAAILAGKDIALANKEVLVAAGSLFTDAVKKAGVKLLPVDSEHSAIFQCLTDHPKSEVERLILTASGGPFRERSSLEGITPAQALKHPNWTMGAKITIDSATLFNKGLELIEAHWLFGIPRVDVVVHPQSVVHSLVEFVDGSVLAQLGEPEMLLPIQYALTWPRRSSGPVPKLNLLERNRLDFHAPNEELFPSLRLAREAWQAGGLAPAHLSAADEVAVELFLKGELAFTDIPRLLELVIERLGAADYSTLDEVRFALDAGRATARELAMQM
ncbi:1-deoxy-D-xylulose-5-phosphate reductoisomerase, partial [bacterium]|nr:1-deoxy-D-xylulose-5-phosphate reductoisomerase [bacterium]